MLRETGDEMKEAVFLKNTTVQAIIASLLCIIIGVFVGFLVLCIIEPSGSLNAICCVMKNFFNYGKTTMKIKYLGNTLARTAPLLMCSLSVLFSYKVGLFNIGVAGQYVAGSCASLYAALAWEWSWLACLLFAIAVGIGYGVITGVLKVYRNVNEVISGILLNWISLYTTNMILNQVKDNTSPYTYSLKAKGSRAILPDMGLDKVFSDNQYVGIAIPLSIFFAIIMWIVLNKTCFGYELKVTGGNRHTARYCGMAEHRNIICTLAISGALAAVGGTFLYLTNIEQWQITLSSLPGMGFNGIAAAFLGGLHPIGVIVSSFFIQHITEGGAHLDLNRYSPQISDLISSIIIYLCGFMGFFKASISQLFSKREEKYRKNEGEK